MVNYLHNNSESLKKYFWNHHIYIDLFKKYIKYGDINIFHSLNYKIIPRTKTAHSLISNYYEYYIQTSMLNMEYKIPTNKEFIVQLKDKTYAYIMLYKAQKRQVSKERTTGSMTRFQRCPKYKGHYCNDWQHLTGIWGLDDINIIKANSLMLMVTLWLNVYFFVGNMHQSIQG